MFAGTVPKQLKVGPKSLNYLWIVDQERDGIFAAIFLTGLIGYSMNAAFGILEKRVVHWSGKF